MRKVLFSGDFYCGRLYYYNVVLYDLFCLMGSASTFVVEVGLSTNSYSLVPLKNLDFFRGLLVLRFSYLLSKNFPFFNIVSYFSKVGVQHRARRRVIDVYNFFFNVGIRDNIFSYNLFFFFDFFRFSLYEYCCKRAQYVEFVYESAIKGLKRVEHGSFLFYDSYVRDFELRRFMDFYISLFSRMINEILVPLRSSVYFVFFNNSGVFVNKLSLCEVFFSFLGFNFLERRIFLSQYKDYSFYQRIAF